MEISIRGVSKLTSLNGLNFTLFTFLRLTFSTMNFEMKPIFVDYHKGHGWFFFRFLCKLKVFLSVFPIWINNSTVFCWLAHP